ncbi:MAG TPA: serine hydrolase, partial [Pseudonocardia sp.]|nr:serine hydrolase [Pseudonocardia sp.]
MRRVGMLALLAAGVVIATALGAPAATAAPATGTAGAGAGPGATGPACPDQAVPPPPPAATEVGVPAPPPLPVPTEPVGGPDLGCGEIAATAAPLPPVGAASFVLADLDSGAVLATRAPHARHRPASALKVLTALVALRTLDPATVVEGTPQDLHIDGSKAGLGPGGRYTVHELLAGLLLNSGNDAAQALSRAVGGDAAMVAAMSALARDTGALDTRPATPSGLDGPGMASSAYDLAVLYRVAMRDPLFASTIALRSVPFPGYDPEHPGFELFNSSRLLAGYPGSLGSKSGFTEAARHTLVAAAERDGRRLVVALMRGENAPEPVWRQAAALLDWGFAQPAGVTPVGVLVDSPPPPPAPPPTLPTTPPPVP